MSMLDALDEKALKKKREKKEKKKKAPKPKTWEVSLSLYRQGMNPDLIARERGLTIGTIVDHLLRYVASGDIPFDELIPPERVALIRQAIAAAGPDAPLSIIRDHCPMNVSYDEIRIIQKHISKR